MMITMEDIEAMKDETMTPLEMVREFATKMGQELDQEWVYDSDVDTFRCRLVGEEFLEFLGATDKENLLKELADLVYVTYGYAATFGLDLDEAVRRVHLSNLSKLGDGGNPIKDESGKVMKSPNYKKPDLGDLV